jgi:hypothetical protein
VSGNTDYILKISITGPSRVGKTSLIASILNDSQRLLEGTPVSMHPNGAKTERRIAQHHKELSGSIRAGEFHPGAVSGTEESFKYELNLDSDNATEGIRLGILDYPGGWIDANRRPEESASEWAVCQDWLKDSSVLIVPVESAVMMEATCARHRKAIPSILNTYDVEQVIRTWAKARSKRPDEPALLIFCPVKCESYFADNGGQYDSSATLFKAFEDNYRDALKAAKGEASNVKIIYAPVDTVGCVEIVKANWSDESQEPGETVFSADYRVRRPGHQSVKGADAVLISLCRHLISVKHHSEDEKLEVIEVSSQKAEREAKKDNGFFGNIWASVSGERRRTRVQAAGLSETLEEQKMIVKDLGATIGLLATFKFGSRVKEL